MEILVINGSPKGKYSITLQTVLYIEKHFDNHHFEYMNAGAEIKKLEKDFSEAKQKLENADLVIFAYPVYTFIAPSQVHRFIELIKENLINLSGKCLTQITTSKHFYDITAHRYIEENAFDLKMHVVKGLSADMDDLLTEKGREEALKFFEYLLFCKEKGIFEKEPEERESYNPKSVTAVSEKSCVQDESISLDGTSMEQKSQTEPGNNQRKEAANAADKLMGNNQGKEVVIAADKLPGNNQNKEVVIVADLLPEDTQLLTMIKRFQAVCKYKTKLVNIREFPFKGGCISCFNCSADGKCIYNDGFDSFLREQIQAGSAIVIAFAIKDHSMGARFKMYDDRQFCNGHRTVTMGMPFGYLVSGPYSHEQNLKMIVESRAEVGGNFLAGVATDEYDPDREIDEMSEKLCYAIDHAYVQPANYLGVGGRKIFRDLIWLMQGMMKADHRFFKSHGQYDFPQKKKSTMVKMYAVGALISNKKIKAKMGNKMNEGMIAPYNKVLEDDNKSWPKKCK